MLLEWQEKNPEPRVTVKEVADHIEHVARIAGHDHVGLGGDYDGMSGNAPDDMKGVDSYPALFEELARRGWSDENLGKLASGNILRVMRQVKAVAETLPAPANEEYLLDNASDRPNSR
jgi:membrane dipeptidase